jgi:hypothetical protein
MTNKNSIGYRSPQDGQAELGGQYTTFVQRGDGLWYSVKDLSPLPRSAFTPEHLVAIKGQYVGEPVVLPRSRKGKNSNRVARKEPSTLVTRREIKQLSSPACHPRYEITIPTGTRCKRVHKGGAAGYAVDDVARVQGSNAHDLAHYYVWVDPAELVDIT